MLHTTFEQPPRRLNSEGALRRVGFEFEYAGLPLQASCEIVTRLFGGEIERANRFHFQVKGTRFGDFSLESDSSLLKNRSYEKHLRALGLEPEGSEWGDKLEGFIEQCTQDLVPFELVTPPIPLSDLSTMDELREELRKSGAQGTHRHFFAAYGMQFNPEMPAFDAKTLLSYMRAFFLLYDHLRSTCDVPISRRVLPYIDPFPSSYVQKVLEPGYEPDFERFVRDYLTANPTRNRPLDWLPLFKHLVPEILASYPVEHALVKARPTLHYRLPSSLIDDPSWLLSREWNKWVLIERLAGEPNLLDELSAEWLLIHSPFGLRSESRWLRRSLEIAHELS